MNNNLITVNARKFDDSIHRTWTGNLINETPEYWFISGRFESEIVHNQLGKISLGTISHEYYFKNEWFNVFKFLEPNGDFRNFYCNISLPPVFESATLNFVDLDIDVLVWADCRIEILDENEFEENRIRLNYPNEIVTKTIETLEKILKIIRLKEFPFDSLAKPLNLSKIE